MQVEIWQETITLPTYRTGEPDKNPMFFENRIYQGSSGTVYPNPVIEKIEDEKVPVAYQALFLENDYLKIMVIPQLGGRVHMAYDKIARRHFIYYNEVVKPALVGLCGPWLSGGIEFNWPQHHRPSTYDPIDYKIEEHDDGSKTIWVNEVEKMFHTKGLAGFTLYPDKAYLEIRGKLYNRTNLPQTFLWWANPAVSVNEHYQSVFPPDVNAVFDHGKRDVSTFPIATGTYYKVDYAPGTDISRYKNIPVPTSYMAVNSNFNFVGGYENDTRAGVLHVADHHISPGKKQWTWGNGDFGVAWDRNLTDDNGPYIELMTGVFTDNQPDFTWLMPCEEKSFVQYFMPYREVGLVKNATKDILIGLDIEEHAATVHVFGTSWQPSINVVLMIGDTCLLDDVTDISPEHCYSKKIPLLSPVDKAKFALYVHAASGKELISYIPAYMKINEIPEPAKPALLPSKVETNEQLFLTGQHLEQYRHATYSPVPYYEEALRRDSSDIRNNNALGVWYLRRGKFATAEAYLRKAVESVTQKNPNPYDSEPYYHLGLSLSYQDKTDEAYNAFFKATWSSAWQDSGYFAVAQIDLIRQDYERALSHINWSIDRNARNGKAHLVKMVALKELGLVKEAIFTGEMALKRDCFNLTVLFFLAECHVANNSAERAQDCLAQFDLLSRGAAHSLVEYAIEFAELGMYAQSIAILKTGYQKNADDPVLNYYISFYSSQIGDRDDISQFASAASLGKSDKNFPNRLEDIRVLQWAIKSFDQDAMANYLLGNLWYDKKQYLDAMACWEKAAALTTSFPTVFRNLAIGAFNKQQDPVKARDLLEKAFSLDTKDARVLMELDQLYKRINLSPARRLEFLKLHLQTALLRDDLFLEIAALENFLGRHEESLRLLTARKFHPWEGGEGRVSGQYVYSLTELAKTDLFNGHFAGAILKLEKAQIYPHHLGEGKLPGTRENDIFFWLGHAYEKAGDREQAIVYWELATVGLAEPSAAMFYNDQQPDKIFYQGLAWRELGDQARAQSIFDELIRYGHTHMNDEIKIDYFAVSLPDLLIFDDNLERRNRIHCLYVAGLGHLGLENFTEAETMFNNVLKNDSMHFGAQIHLNLINRYYKQAGMMPAN